MSESTIQARIREVLGRLPHVRLFRNNVAKAWVPTGPAIIARCSQTVTMGPGDVLLRKARILHAGLVEGSGDFVGWTVITVTPDMIGARLPVFTNVECKSPSGRISPAQTNFVRAVQAAGGFAGFARSVQDAESIINGNASRIPSPAVPAAAPRVEGHSAGQGGAGQAARRNGIAPAR